MGVDLQTYRAKIGTFRHSVGEDVVTIVRCVNLTGGIKAVGSVLFIGLLLIIAGIEQNPGPKDDDSRQLRQRVKENPAAQAIDNAVPPVLNTDSLEDEKKRLIHQSEKSSDYETNRFALGDALLMIFRNYLRWTRTKITIFIVGTTLGIMVFYDAMTGLTYVIFMSLFVVGVVVHKAVTDHTFFSDFSVLWTTEQYFFRRKPKRRLDKENIGIVHSDTENKQQNQSRAEQEMSQTHPSLDDQDKLLEALKTTNAEDDNDQIDSGTAKGQQFKLSEEGNIMSQNNQSFNEVDEQLEALTDVKVEDDNDQIDSGTAKGQQFKLSEEGNIMSQNNQSFNEVDEQLEALTDVKEAEMDVTNFQQTKFRTYLDMFGLQNKYPGKITLGEVIAVRCYEQCNDSMTGEDVKDIPWQLLQRLVSTHSEARDKAVIEHDEDESEEDSLCFLSDCNASMPDISPLEIFYIVYLCCDHNLQQVLYQKLYLCKLAVPFLYINYDDKSPNPMISKWPLRFLTVENKSKTGETKQTDALDLTTKVVAFARYGRPKYSKSELINYLLSIHGCKTFFNKECPSGNTRRIICNGFVEMFWLTTIGNNEDTFQDAVTFLNLRGDLKNNFSADVISMLANVADTLMIIIEICSLEQYSESIAQLIFQFPSITLIFPHPLQATDKVLTDRLCNVLRTRNSKIKLEILSTHKRKEQRNIVNMAPHVSTHISKQLQSADAKCLEQRLENCIVLTDECKTNCVNGKKLANELYASMKEYGEPTKWKIALTPIHCTFSKQIGKLKKKHARETVLTEVTKIEDEISKIRYTQRNSVTPSLLHFAGSLVKLHENLPELEYFLGWLRFFIEREKRKVIPPLMREYRSAWQKLKDLQSNETSSIEHAEDIDIQKKLMANIETKIDEASFSTDHFFRELGHIYDAFLESKTANYPKEFPELTSITKAVASCILNGHQFELIDGDSFYMPYEWIRHVFMEIEHFIGTRNVMTLSVLGLQSSGKSTLLNTMFGLQFPAKTGRCTRGIQMQLLPINNYVQNDKNRTKHMPFNYVAVIDTEGLRSSEISNIKHEHDNELATIITGLGDITLMNIMGENTSEIKDILQVIVHAFLRLKRTNGRLDIVKHSSFIHQNVTDTSASEKMICSLSNLMQTLDEMTKESALSEGIPDITHFNQIIQFDMHSQVFYLKNLWQGNPPMARVNYQYSECVVEIKNKILQWAISVNGKSYKTISDVLTQGYDLWKGVLNEDFIFSFRNSLEIKAYTEMERFMQGELWKLERVVHEKLTDLTTNNFASCDKTEKLEEIKKQTETDLMSFQDDEKSKIESKVDIFFAEYKYSDIIIQWKQTQIYRLDVLNKNLGDAIKNKIQKHLDKRSIDILTVSRHSKHEEEIWKKSMDVANSHRGENFSKEQVDDLFEKEIWSFFVQRDLWLPSLRTTSNNSFQTLQEDFRKCLHEIFNTEKSLLKNYLLKSNQLAKETQFKQLQGSVEQIGIDENDVVRSRSWFIYLRKESKEHFIKNVKMNIDNMFKIFDKKISRFDKIDDDLTYIQITSLLHDLLFALTDITRSSDAHCFVIQNTFHMKILVHVSNFACHIFNEHNTRYQGLQARLNTYKQQLKISFEAHLSNRQFEDTFATLLSNVVEVFIREKTRESIQNKVTELLLSKVPNVKNQVIFSIMTKLAKKGDFNEFIKYIQAPKGFAEVWLESKCNKYLFGKKYGEYSALGKSIVTDLFGSVLKCIEQFEVQHDSEKSDVDAVVFEMINLFKDEKLIIPNESFRILLKRTGKLSNIQYLSRAMLDQITMSKAKLQSELDSITQDTVKWTECHPIDRIFKQVWGCHEQCAFCGEPCSKNDQHTESDHYSLQHRPLCCSGIRGVNSKMATMESCNFQIQSKNRHSCSAFSYLCNVPERKDCSMIWHNYTDYKKFLKNWDVPPSTNMQETSKFWLWFVAKYKHDLAKHYNYKVDNIPPSWGDITKEQAIQSIKDVYFA